MQIEKSIQNIVSTIQELLLNPTDFWEKEKKTEKSHWQITLGYYFPLVLVVSFSVFLGSWLTSNHFYIGFLLLKALRIIILYLLQFYASVFLVNKLSKPFLGELKSDGARKLVAYSFTPIMLAAIVSGIFPALYIVNVVGLYGVYIFWTGVNKIMIINEEKKSGFVLISLLLSLFVFAVFSKLLWEVIEGLY